MSVLTVAEAAAALRISPVPDEENPDPVLDLVLPAVDDFLKTSTGYDWAADETIDPTAKMAATMLLVQWYENPAMINQVDTAQYGLTSQLEQLRVKKLPPCES